MHPYEMQFQLLARLIRTGDDHMISSAVTKMFETNKTHDLEMVDKCNIPFLTGYFASESQGAKAFLHTHHFHKDHLMRHEKPLILEAFRKGMMVEYGGKGEVEEDYVLTLLTILMHSEDAEYAILALRLFHDLDFHLEDYDTIFDRALRMRNQYPEAEMLVEKIEMLILEFEVVDEDMEVEDEDEEEEDEEGGEDSDSEDEWVEAQNLSFEEEEDELNDSFESEDSGVESDSDELIMEEIQEAEQQHAHFHDARLDILTRVLADSLRRGNSEMIDIAIELLEGFRFPLMLYRKHEISRLILEFGAHNDKAMELMNEIERLGYQVYASETRKTFDEIMRHVQMKETVSNELMQILMDFLITERDKQIVDEIVSVLLTKTITNDQFTVFEIENVLMEIPQKTDDMLQLIAKIHNLKHTVSQEYLMDAEISG